tara:strand:+ start:7371 stop:7685 length:315 start_codon:yes stop_codon:yes gene_type:complete
MNTVDLIKNQISENPVLLYMKGNAIFPQCGFSSQVVHILKDLGVKFESVNVLENPDIRSELPKYANWPTFPQLYISGELVGGCDIITQLYQSGDLKEMLKDFSE